MKKILSNKILTIVIVALIVGGAGFYFGMKYGQGLPRTNQGNFQAGAAGAGRRGAFSQGNGFVSGDIINKDDKSITVQLRDGSSRIVFVSATTPVMKSTAGSSSDLSVGEQVVVTGSSNSDGSLTAQSVQIPPAGATTNMPANR